MKETVASRLVSLVILAICNFMLFITVENGHKIQYSVPSTAEIDMVSSGSGYERYLTSTLTISL